MNDLKEALWQDYSNNTEMINVLEMGSPEYKMLNEERDKIRNELIKVKQIEEDTKIKEKEIQSNNDNEKKRNRINIVTFGISTLVGLGAIIKTFKFDEEATITSTLGKNIISNTISKIFKR